LRGEQRARLAEASAKLLGVDDPLTLQLDVHAAAAQLGALTAQGGTHASQYRAVAERYIGGVTALTDSLRAGSVDAVDYVETVEATVAEFRDATIRLGLSHDHLRDVWTTQLRTRLALYGYTSEQDLEQIVAELCHPGTQPAFDPTTRDNVVLQCPYLWRSLAVLEMVDLAFDFQRALIDLRQRIYDGENDFAPYRRALTGFVALAVDEGIDGARVDRGEVVTYALRALVGHEAVGRQTFTRLSNPRSSESKSEAFGRVLRVLSDYLATSDDTVRNAEISDAFERYRDEIMIRLDKVPVRETWAEQLRARREPRNRD
jgi:hypothetical protein